MSDMSEEQRVAAALDRADRGRRWREAETAITAILSDPEVARLRTLLDEEEAAVGIELQATHQHLQDRYSAALAAGDTGFLSSRCPGKHGRLGRICVLDEGHDDIDPHWGTTPQGRPVAWIGSAPDDW